MTTDTLDAPVRNPVETRAAEVIGVRFPDRVVEIIAAPYDVSANVEVHGRQVSESFAPGTFDGAVDRVRKRKVHVWLDHNHERPAGYVDKIHLKRPEGLVTEMRMLNTRYGNDALELCAEGIYSASVGFAVLMGGEEWSRDRRQRRVTKAFLDHVGLTTIPAYQGTDVLAVRSTMPVVVRAPEPGVPVSTPNLDEVRAWLAGNLNHA